MELPPNSLTLLNIVRADLQLHQLPPHLPPPSLMQNTRSVNTREHVVTPVPVPVIIILCWSHLLLLTIIITIVPTLKLIFLGVTAMKGNFESKNSEIYNLNLNSRNILVLEAIPEIQTPAVIMNTEQTQ